MNVISRIMLLAGQETSDAAADGGLASILSLVVPLLLMVVVLYFLMIRPEKKRSRQTKAMLDNMQIADEVVTSGGIIGRVLNIKEDTVLIETGSDRTRLRVLRSSIIENRTVHDTTVK